MEEYILHNFGEKDHKTLKELGVDGVFAVGTPIQSVVDFIRERV